MQEIRWNRKELIMETTLSSQRNKLIAYIIVASAITVSLLLYNNTMDSFSPKHISIINNITQFGRMTETYTSIQIPGFYAYGPMIVYESGKSSRDLLFLPIQLLPHAIILFCLALKLSRNYILASLIVFLNLNSGFTGTPNIFFWPHGLGTLLYFVCIILLLHMLRDNSNKLPEYILLLIFTGVSIAFISYDNAARLYLLLLSIGLIYLIFGITLNWDLSSNQYIVFAKKLFTILLIMIVVEFGLRKFIYQVFFPFVDNIQTVIELSALDKLSISYFNSDLSLNPLNEFIVRNPEAITILSLVKYGILLFYIFIALHRIFKNLMKHHLNVDDTIIISIIIATLLFAISRISLGQLCIPLLYYPGIFCISWMHPRLKNYKKIVIISMLLLITLTLLSYVENSRNNLLDRETYRYTDDMSYSSRWYSNKTVDNTIGYSDELSKNLFGLYMPVLPYKHILRVDTERILFLTQRLNKTFPEEYFIMNFRSNALTVENWVTLKPWLQHKDVIGNNRNIIKIYDDSIIRIYKNHFIE